jgi:asparagine synthase (glutamine-hydrolysing)
MSAISLVWNTADGLPTNTLHAAMLSALEKYGRDRQFAWSDHRIALGANIFSSLPEDRFDLQPLWSIDRSACLVADVRLDNRADLARELGLTQPEELADSSFLMAAWLRWGATCLDHLIGGFAFAVWMPRQQEVFAARDHTGERPLYYHRGKDLFALASMQKGLLALPNLHRKFRESYTAAWLACLKSDWTGSFFEEIQRLPPGHFLRVTPQTFETRQYWHPANAKPIRFRKDEEYPEALLEIFDRATQARLRSTRPVGSFLSAGLDSSSVTASAARLLALQGTRLTAFTSVPRPGFDGASPAGFFASEATGASEVARLYPNVEHVILDSRGYDLLPTMKLWNDALDEPAPSVVNMLWLSAIFDRARQRGLGVMLEGAEGNGTFSYSSWSILGRLFRRGRLLKFARTAHGLRRRGALSITSAARFAAGGLIPRWLTRRRVPAQTLEALLACLANPEWMQRYNLEDGIFDTFYPAPSSLVQEHSALFDGYDQGPYRAAVQAVTQMEVRDPTADKRIFEFSFAIPPEQYLVGGHSRSLARRAMKHRLPQSVLMCHTRGLQGADWYLPMSESLPELRSELALLARSPAASQALDLPAMETLLDNWPRSNFHSENVYSRWHFWLTRAFSMGYFLRTHEAKVAPATLPAEPVAAPLH